MVLRALGLTAVLAVATHPCAGSAQIGLQPGERAPKWSVEFDMGVRLPGSLYDQFLERVHSSDTIGTALTRWREESDLGAHSRLAVRLNPESGVGILVAGLWGHASTRGVFSGQALPPQTIPRSTGFRGLEVAFTLKLREWDEGRGLFEYNVGTVILSQVIDLRPGHRDALAYFRVGQPPTFDWVERTSTSWGLALGTSVRIPLREGMALRGSFSDLIVPVNTHNWSDQDRADIRRFTGENLRISYRAYTAHHITLSFGLEYTLAWGPRKRDVQRTLPQAREAVEVSTPVRNAMRMATEGDTVGAVAALTHQVRVNPLDGFAWRELALLRGARAEFDPSVRDEALATLERALNLNPGDTDLLRSYGRVRALVEREGRTVQSTQIAALELSELAAAADRDGTVRLGLAIRGLEAAEDGVYRYRIRVELFDVQGRPVAFRGGIADLRSDSGGGVEEETEGDALPLSVARTLFLDRAEAGIYTARVRIVDLVNGVEREVSRGFEIPEV